MRRCFPHPVLRDCYVRIILDACHVVKLMHNLLCEYQIIKVPNVGSVKWQHSDLLHKELNSQGLNLGNTHMRYVSLVVSWADRDQKIQSLLSNKLTSSV